MERYVLCLSQGFKLSDRSPLQWSRKRLRYPRQWIGHSQLSLGFPAAGEAARTQEYACMGVGAKSQVRATEDLPTRQRSPQRRGAHNVMRKVKGDQHFVIRPQKSQFSMN